MPKFTFKTLLYIVGCMLLSGVAHNSSHAMKLKNDLSSFWYFNAGGGIGGNSVYYYNKEAEVVATMETGFGGNGIVGGLNLAAGNEFRISDKHIFFAVEVSSNIMFNNDIISTKFADGSLFWREDDPDDDLTGSTNAYKDLHVNFKFGYTTTNDKFAIFGIFGLGALFSGNQYQAGSQGSYTDMNLNRFSLLYGVGMSYFFKPNIGVYTSFTSLAPFVNDLSGSYGSIDSYSFNAYSVNFGITLRF